MAINSVRSGGAFAGNPVDAQVEVGARNALARLDVASQGKPLNEATADRIKAMPRSYVGQYKDASGQPRELWLGSNKGAEPNHFFVSGPDCYPGTNKKVVYVPNRGENPLQGFPFQKAPPTAAKVALDGLLKGARAVDWVKQRVSEAWVPTKK
jgi:hypothetical protein